MKCPYCNQEMEDGSKVCTACGQALTDVMAEQPTAVQAQEAGSVPEEPKKGKKWIIPAAVVAVAAVGAGVFWMSGQVDPKEAVIGAFKSIVAEDQVSPAEEIFGLRGMMEMIEGGAYETSLNLAYESGSEPDLEILSGGGIVVDAFSDLANMKVAADVAVEYADMSLGTLQMYLDESQIVVAAPEFTDKAFTLDLTESLVDQSADSPFVGPWLESQGMDIAGLDAYLDQYMELMKTTNEMFDIEALWGRYKAGSQAIENLKTAMTAEKSDKKMTLEGSSESFKGYDVTISKDSLIQFMKSSKEFVLEDATLKADMVKYLGLMLEMQAEMAAAQGTESMTAEDMQAMLWTEAETGLDELIAQLEACLGDVSMTVYVKKDGSMAAFTFDTVYTVDETATNIEGDVTFNGGYNMLADVDAVVRLEDAAGKSGVVTLSTDNVYEEGKVWNTNVTTAMDMDGTKAALTIADHYNVADGSHDFAMEVQMDEKPLMKISMDGYYENIVVGKGFDYYFDSLMVEYAYEDPAGEPLDGHMELSGYYMVGPLEAEVVPPAGEPLDVFEGTETDYNAVMYEVAGKLMGLMMQLGQ